MEPTGNAPSKATRSRVTGVHEAVGWHLTTRVTAGVNMRNGQTKGVISKRNLLGRQFLVQLVTVRQ